jgi:hypothetical protein
MSSVKTSGRENGVKHLLKSRRTLAAIGAVVIAVAAAGTASSAPGSSGKNAPLHCSPPAEGCNGEAVGDDRR